MIQAEARLRHRMDVPTFMTLFHMSFLLVGLFGLFLIAVRVIPFDFDASLAVVVAILLNVVFAFLWAGQIGKKAPQKQAPMAPPSPMKATRLSSMVSFVITTYNDERAIAGCIDTVFKTAVGYRGPSEVIVVDDGSSDDTYETAWRTLDYKRQEVTNIPARVIKHLTHLGVAETLRTAVGKASGEYIALIDAKVACDPLQLAGITDRVYPAPKTAEDVRSNDGLYSTEALRQLLY